MPAEESSVEVMRKYWLPIPASSRRRDGVEVPRPKLPAAVKCRSEAPVDEAMSKSCVVCPAEPAIANVAFGVEVPMPTKPA